MCIRRKYKPLKLPFEMAKSRIVSHNRKAALKSANFFKFEPLKTKPEFHQLPQQFCPERLCPLI